MKRLPPTYDDNDNDDDCIIHPHIKEEKGIIIFGLIILVTLSITSLIFVAGRQHTSLDRLSSLQIADSIPLDSESPITKTGFFS